MVPCVTLTLEIKQRRFSAESTIVPVALNKEMVSFVLSEWRPWAADGNQVRHDWEAEPRNLRAHSITVERR